MGSTVPHSLLPVPALATAASFSDFLPFLLPPAEVHLALLCQPGGPPSHADRQSESVSEPGVASPGLFLLAVTRSHLGA